MLGFQCNVPGGLVHIAVKIEIITLDFTSQRINTRNSELFDFIDEFPAIT